MKVLDLFSGAAGGWSLGMHRAGFRTVAACEVVPWRREVYLQNNPGVVMYDDVQTLTAERLLEDLGELPDVVVGSPPCQDISSANAKGRGVDGDKSKLFFEFIRLVGELRPRWVAAENSANLRTRGADRVLAALEALGYPCEPLVVRAGTRRKAAGVGANHERPRVWLVGFDSYAAERGWAEGCGPYFAQPKLPGGDDALNAQGLGHQGGRSRGHGPDGDGGAPAPRGAAADAGGAGYALRESQRGDLGASPGATPERDVAASHGDASDAAGAGRERPGSTGAQAGDRRCVSDSIEACGIEPDADGQGQPDGAQHGEMGGRAGAGGDAGEPWSDWNGGLARHLRLDDGLSAWLAGERIAVGGPRGTAASHLAVEAYGDAVLPQIPEAIGRAILRVEAMLAII